MYGPAPVKLKKTSIIRSRTGCKPCRRRRKKCDEGRPCCSRCRDSRDRCWYEDASFEFRDANQWAASQVKKVRGDRLDIKSASTLHQCSDPSLSISGPGNGTMVSAELSKSPASIKTFQISGQLMELSTTESAPATSGIGQSQGPRHNSFHPALHRSLHGCLPPSLAGPEISSTDHKYLSHFVHHVVQIMPVNQGAMLSFLSGSRVSLQAAMAIGAASLANLQGKYSINTPTISDDDYSWTSHRCHRINALDYTDKALSTIAYAQDHNAAASSDIGTLVATHIMLSFVELELGTFEGLRRYLDSADHLVRDNYKMLLGSSQGRKVLRGLANTRALHRFLAGPVGPMSRESPISRFWQGVERKVSLERCRMQRICYTLSTTLERLCLLTTMRHCRNSHTTLARTVAKHLRLFANCEYIFRNGIQASEENLDAACLECVAEIRILSDEILSLPPPDGLPLPQSEDSRCGKIAYSEISELPTDQVEPLRFGSHEEAMHAADYVFCRLMCNSSVVSSIRDPSGVEGKDDSAVMGLSTMPWLHLLVRIALGLDLSSCVSRNTYRRGICTMLLHSAIRCLSPKVCLILEGLLDRLIGRGCTWEDTTFPSVLSVSTVRAIRGQLEQGRIVLFLSTVKRDFDAKFTIKAHRMTRTLLMHGWEAGGRGVFDESLLLDGVGKGSKAIKVADET